MRLLPLLLSACVWISADDHDAILSGLSGDTGPVGTNTTSETTTPGTTPTGTTPTTSTTPTDCPESVWYADDDDDGFGDPEAQITGGCEPPEGYIGVAGDCDDTQDKTNPNGVDVECDGVDVDCDGFYEGDAWVPTVWDSIEKAITNTESGTICVEPGIYAEHIAFDGGSIQLRGVAGAEQTVLEPVGRGPIVTFSEKDDRSTLLQGFTITGGEISDDTGHACIDIIDGSPTLMDVTVSECFGEGIGAGIYISGGSPLLDNVRSINNEADGGGAGLAVVAAEQVEMIGGDVSWNRCGAGWGGGVYLVESYVSLLGVEIRGNSTETIGGGVCSLDSDLLLNGVNISGNEAATSAGGMYISTYYGGDASLHVENATFVGNTAGEAGGIYLADVDEDTTLIASFTNTIIGGNTATNAGASAGGVLGWELEEPAVFSYSSVTGNEPVNLYSFGADGHSNDMIVFRKGVGNSKETPRFVRHAEALEPKLWDLHLMPESTLIDAGHPHIVDTDDSKSDIGAYGGPYADANYYKDSDRDQMYNGWESAEGLDPANNDAAEDRDLDGLSNLDEFRAGTIPSNPDTDGDGALDGEEINMGTDPLSPDEE